MIGVLFTLLLLAVITAAPFYYLKKKNEKPDVYVWVGEGKNPLEEISE